LDTHRRMDDSQRKLAGTGPDPSSAGWRLQSPVTRSVTEMGSNAAEHAGQREMLRRVLTRSDRSQRDGLG
jgi:hypothetical protein